VGTYNHALGAGIDVRDAQNPWDVHEANPVDQLFSDVRSGTGFDNSVGAGPFDDAVGVQWNDFQTTGQPSGNITVFEVLWRFGRSDALALDPVTASRTQGEAHTVNVQLQPGPTAAPNRTVVYSVAGANPTTGALTADANGQAALSWTGANAGTDTLTAFWDATGDGVRQPHEAQEQATIDWAQPPPPPPRLRRGETLQVGLVEGTVLIAERAPSARGARAGVAQLGPFRKLTGIEQIRMGSVLDTRRGTVRLTTARNRLGTIVQRGNFKGSQFRVRQSTGSALTTLRMRGGSFSRCKRNLSRGAAYTAQRRTIRRLRGSARGRFRTRGRRSSATVRGTRWIMEDRCDGTLTVVRDGSVRVRDFARRRTVVVRAGRRYLARVARNR
jgi:hypothetical protein